jgi:uncharacterized membrane protein YphA (DoxX/SURF4 family)
VESPHQQYLLRLVIEAVAGVFLSVGLWTPVAGAATAMIGLWSMFSGAGDPWSQLQLAILGAGLAMIGPGALSVDVRLFGRKRIDLPNGRAGLNHSKE